MEYRNPITGKETEYLETELSKPTNKSIGKKFKQGLIKLLKCRLSPMLITREEQKMMTAAVWEGKGEHMTLIRKFRDQNYVAAEVVGYIKDPKAVCHALNSTIMGHRIPNLVAVVENNRLFLVKMAI